MSQRRLIPFEPSVVRALLLHRLPDTFEAADGSRAEPWSEFVDQCSALASVAGAQAWTCRSFRGMTGLDRARWRICYPALGLRELCWGAVGRNSRLLQGSRMVGEGAGGSEVGADRKLSARVGPASDPEGPWGWTVCQCVRECRVISIEIIES